MGRSPSYCGSNMDFTPRVSDVQQKACFFMSFSVKWERTGSNTLPTHIC